MHRNNQEFVLAKKENASLPIFTLMSDFREIEKAYSLSPFEDRFKKVLSANQFQLSTPYGRIILTEWKGALHEVNYQTPQTDSDIRLRKLRFLFSSYQHGFRWVEVADNGFGKFFESSDGSVFGMWAYPNDTISFVSNEYRKEESKPK